MTNVLVRGKLDKDSSTASADQPLRFLPLGLQDRVFFFGENEAHDLLVSVTGDSLVNVFHLPKSPDPFIDPRSLQS